MSTQTTTRLPGLDMLRALAILLVMTFHLGYMLPPVLAPVVSIGWMGVDLFFVLSGYLIGLQLLRPYLSNRKPSLREFYSRRALRILPAYLVVVLLYFAWPSWREQPGLSPPWQFISFTENLFVSYADHKAFSHVWSLCIEEHFYLVLPLLVLLLFRRPSLRQTITVFGAFVLLGIAVRTFELIHVLRATPITQDGWYVLYYEHIYYPTWTRLDGLLAGVALASVQMFRPAWWSRLTAYGDGLLGGFALLFSTSAWLFRDRGESDTGVAAWGTIIGFPLIALAFALLVLSAVSVTGMLRRMRVPGTQLLASLAFTLYLTHKEAAHLMRLWFPNATSERGLQSLLIYSASCLAMASLLHFCIERPFLRLRMSPAASAAELGNDPAL